MTMIYTQSGPVSVEIGRRYHVLIRHQQFGNDEYDATLQHLQVLDPSPADHPGQYRPFTFLSFAPTSVDRWPGDGRGARDFTIARLTALD